MVSRVEFQIGMRHLRSRRKRAFVSVTTWISILGIALGVMTLIVVVGVMSGFERELRTKILGTQSHVVVVEAGSNAMRGWREALSEVKKQPEVIAASPFVYGQAMLTARGAVTGAVIRGIDPAREAKVSEIQKNIQTGGLERLVRFTVDRSALPPGAEPLRAGIVLGSELAASLGLKLGDEVIMVSPTGTITPMGVLPRTKRFQIVGTFRSGYYQFDSGMAYISLEEAQRFFGLGQDVTGIHLRIRDIFAAERVAQDLQKRLGLPFWPRSWQRMNQSLFSALKTEKTTMTILLLLVIVVAAFNIMGSLVMVVMEKGREIAILKSMGATRGSILRIFFYQGAIIGLAGSIFGTLGGLVLSWKLYVLEDFLEKFFGLDILPPSVYHIDRLPVDLSAFNVAVTAIVAVIISLVATLYPAWRASRVDPVEMLRYG
ncbi:MAG: lipoprotein-releasing ABC transporter permease subunit [bacterium]|nr:lipoprotein-releasing ABC transporter permease subunit [bacterium]